MGKYPKEIITELRLEEVKVFNELCALNGIIEPPSLYLDNGEYNPKAFDLKYQAALNLAKLHRETKEEIGVYLDNNRY